MRINLPIDDYLPTEDQSILAELVDNVKQAIRLNNEEQEEETRIVLSDWVLRYNGPHLYYCDEEVRAGAVH